MLLLVAWLFVAPVLLLLSYVLGPTPMDLLFWPGAVLMMFLSTLTDFRVVVNDEIELR